MYLRDSEYVYDYHLLRHWLDSEYVCVCKIVSMCVFV